ncbi:MAG TPA: DUF5993 family protein [Holophagaceae bacterium]|nr:DUF5993 family protein [Holophagaceae bacterium]
MDPLLFLLIFATFWSLRRGPGLRPRLFFLGSLAAVALLFNHHVTAHLALGF